MKPLFRLGVGALAAAALAGSAAVATGASAEARAQVPADTVITDAYVYTVDTKHPEAEAVAIRDGKIVYVGTSTGVQSYIGPKTKVEDVQGRMVMPGLIDAHAHPGGAGAGLTGCSLDYQELTVDETLTAVQDCIDDERGFVGPADNRWLQIRYWNLQGLKPAGTTMTRLDLDRLNTTVPMFMVSTDGHNGLANSKALQVAGITKDTPDPTRGFMERDPDGNPTGYFSDANSLVTSHIPSKSDADTKRDLKASLDALNATGVTAFFGNSGSLKNYNELQDEDELTARVSAAASGDLTGDMDALIATLNSQKALYDKGNVHVNTVGEILVDGVMEYPAFTASLLDPYLTKVDDEWVPSSNRGPSYFSDQQMKTLVVALDKAGWNGHFHTIGDRAVRQVLDGVAAARAANGVTDTIFSTTHNELVAPSDIPRFASLRVIANFSPQWAQRDAYTVDNLADYLGPERAGRLYPIGAIAATGATVSTGSDWPVDELNPWRMIEQAVTRTGAAGYDGHPGALSPDDAVTLKQSIAMITKNAAKQIGLWNEIGSIEVGKDADLLVLDQNLFDVKLGQIHKTAPAQVYFDGRVIHQADKAESTTTVKLGKGSVSFGAKTSMAITVSSDSTTPTGTVTVKDGAKTVAQSALRDGKATVQVGAGLAAGKHNLSVSYGGDFSAATSSATTQLTVTKARTVTSLSIKHSTIKRHSRAKVTVTVKVPGTTTGAAGKVRIMAGSKTVSTLSVKAGRSATVKLPVLKPGRHKLRAVFTGSGNLKGSSSSSKSLKVKR